jgi:uncharacterized paraquat-inducible protein A
MNNANEIYETSVKMYMIINTPEYASYYRSYNAGIIVIFILVMIIPIILLVYVIYQNNSKQTSLNQNIDSINIQKRKQFLLENNLPSDINDKCLEYVRWVYSNRLTDPMYKKCNIQSLSEAHQYVVCLNTSNTIDPSDRSMVCSVGDNFDKSKCPRCFQ